MAQRTIIDLETRLNSASVKRVEQRLRGIERRVSPINLSLNSKRFTEPLGRISGGVDEFNKSLDASNARVIAFGASVGIIYSVQRAFQELAKTVVDVEKRIADIQVLFNLPTDELTRFRKSLFQVAKDTGQAFDVVATAATEFSRQGLSVTETLERTQQALILTRLSGLDAEKSVQTLTAAINTFQNEAIKATEVTSRFAAVDAAFAVDSADLAQAIQRSAAAAQGAKVSFNELLAATTAIQERTARGGNIIGNSLKSIFTRIQRSRVREVLEGLGVATTDLNGNLRNGIDIIKDYAGIYDTLSDQVQAYTDEQIAGLFQINNLKALVADLKNDFGSYAGALDVANQATDEAIKRNEQLNQTTSALINKSLNSLKEIFDEIGESGLNDFFKNTINIFNNFISAISGSAGVIANTFGPLLLGVATPLAIGVLKQTLKFIKDIVISLSSYGRKQQEIKTIQSQINALLAQNPQLYSQIIAQSGNLLAQQKLITAEFQNQVVARQRLSSLTASIAPAVGRTIPKGQRNFASGRNPILDESIAINKGVGGASRNASPKVIKNFNYGRGKSGSAVVNTDEYIVKNFQGSGSDAVFNKDMIRRMGLPSGARKISGSFTGGFLSMAGGFINSNDVERIIEKEKSGIPLKPGEISKLNNSINNNSPFFRNLPTNTKQALLRINQQNSQNFRNSLPFGPIGGTNRPSSVSNPLVVSEKNRAIRTNIEKNIAQTRVERTGIGELDRRAFISISGAEARKKRLQEDAAKLARNKKIDRQREIAAEKERQVQIQRYQARLEKERFDRIFQSDSKNFTDISRDRIFRSYQPELPQKDLSGFLSSDNVLSELRKKNPKLAEKITQQSGNLSQVVEEKRNLSSTAAQSRSFRELKFAEIQDLKQRAREGKLNKTGQLKLKQAREDLLTTYKKEKSIKSELTNLDKSEIAIRKDINSNQKQVLKNLKERTIIGKTAGTIARSGKNVLGRVAGNPFGIGFAGSILAGYASQKTENETASGALQGAALGLGTGALFGPAGLLIGGLGGSLLGSGLLDGIFDSDDERRIKKAKNALDKYNDAIGEEQQKRVKVEESTTRYIKAIEQYNKAIESGDEIKAQKLFLSTQEYLSEISDPKFVKAIQAVGTDTEKLAEIFAEFTKKTKINELSTDIVNRFSGGTDGELDSFIKSFEGGVFSILTKKDEKEIKKAFGQIIGTGTILQNFRDAGTTILGDDATDALIKNINANNTQEQATKIFAKLLELFADQIGDLDFAKRSGRLSTEIETKLLKFRKDRTAFANETLDIFSSGGERLSERRSLSNEIENRVRRFKITRGSLTENEASLQELAQDRKTIVNETNENRGQEVLGFLRSLVNKGGETTSGKFAQELSSNLLNGGSNINDIVKRIEESNKITQEQKNELSDKLKNLTESQRRKLDELNIKKELLKIANIISNFDNLRSLDSETSINAGRNLMSEVEDYEDARKRRNALDVLSSYGVKLSDQDEETIRREARIADINKAGTDFLQGATPNDIDFTQKNVRFIEDLVSKIQTTDNFQLARDYRRSLGNFVGFKEDDRGLDKFISVFSEILPQLRKLRTQAETPDEELGKQPIEMLNRFQQRDRNEFEKNYESARRSQIESIGTQNAIEAENLNKKFLDEITSANGIGDASGVLFKNLEKLSEIAGIPLLDFRDKERFEEEVRGGAKPQEAASLVFKENFLEALNEIDLASRFNAEISLTTDQIEQQKAAIVEIEKSIANAAKKNLDNLNSTIDLFQNAFPKLIQEAIDNAQAKLDISDFGITINGNLDQAKLKSMENNIIVAVTQIINEKLSEEKSDIKSPAKSPNINGIRPGGPMGGNTSMFQR